MKKAVSKYSYHLPWILAFIIAATFTFPILCSASDMSPDKISAIAEKAKDRFVGAIAMQYLKQYGATEIASEQPPMDLEDAMNPTSSAHNYIKQHPTVVLGKPFKVYSIDTSNIVNYSAGTDLASIVVPTTQWLVPVFIHNKPRAMLTVDDVDGVPQVININMRDMSETVDKATKMNITGGQNKFLRIYALSCDFILTSSNGQNKVLPLSYSVKKLGLDTSLADSSGLFGMAEVMQKLGQKIKEHAEQ